MFRLRYLLYSYSHGHICMRVSITRLWYNRKTLIKTIAERNSGTGCVANFVGKTSHSRSAESFKCICQVAPMCTSSLVHDLLGPSHSPSQTAARSVQPFFHGRCHVLPIQYVTAHSPISLAPYPCGSGPVPSNTWLLGPTRRNTSNGISIESAVFPQYTPVMSG